jgi:nucleoside-diphosphate-sugar epimerase
MQTLPRMKVLITGGAGFIGSHIAEASLARGDEVYILDDLSTGTLENIRHLQEHSAYGERLFITVDSVLHYEKTLELVGICDVVIHLAAAVGVQYILDNPLTSIFTNVRGTDLVLELCNKFKKKVLIASTSEVYGRQNHAPLKETDYCVYGPSTKSRWSYAASKLIDELTALAYYRTTKLPVLIVRFFNTVGPRQTWRYGMVVPRFVKQALAHEPITVYGDGTQTRTFTHVQDVTAAVLKLIDTPEAVGEVVNIGGAEEVSVLELAERVKIKVGSTSEIKLIPYSEVYPSDFEDMHRRVPSTAKLKSLIGYAPRMDLDKILDDTIAYYRSREIP